jgi:hypothetical protein
MEYFRRVKRDFPGSPYADKAGAELVGTASPVTAKKNVAG